MHKTPEAIVGLCRDTVTQHMPAIEAAIKPDAPHFARIRQLFDCLARATTPPGGLRAMVSALQKIMGLLECLIGAMATGFGIKRALSDNPSR